MLRGNHPLLQSRLAFRCMENQSRSVSLLQNDEEIETREQNLEKAKRKYQLEQKTFKLTEDQRQKYQRQNGQHIYKYKTKCFASKR